MQGREPSAPAPRCVCAPRVARIRARGGTLAACTLRRWRNALRERNNKFVEICGSSTSSAFWQAPELTRVASCFRCAGAGAGQQEGCLWFPRNHRRLTRGNKTRGGGGGGSTTNQRMYNNEQGKGANRQQCSGNFLIKRHSIACIKAGPAHSAPAGLPSRL